MEGHIISGVALALHETLPRFTDVWIDEAKQSLVKVFCFIGVTWLLHVTAIVKVKTRLAAAMYLATMELEDVCSAFFYLLKTLVTLLTKEGRGRRETCFVVVKKLDEVFPSTNGCDCLDSKYE